MVNDKNCNCYKIQQEIDNEFPESDWNLDEACNSWSVKSLLLKDNNIIFDEGSDEYYACTCPTCGRIICGWCI